MRSSQPTPCRNRCARRAAAIALCLSAALYNGMVQACTVVTGSLAFGGIDVLLPVATESSAVLQVSCPESTGYSISLSAGSGSFSARRMNSGAHELQYQLYADASRLNPWGDGSGGTVVVAGSADAGGSTHTVYGRVPHQPLAQPGFYSDNLLVTVSF